MKEKVLVTGATGFVGSNLCRKLLEQNFEVFILVRKSSKFDYLEDIKDKLNIVVWNGNIDELIGNLKEIEIKAVFHLASLVKIEHKKEEVEGLINSNILYGTKLLEAMKYSQIKIFINTGTYWQHYNSEEYNPVDLYAATKEAFEKIIKYYVEAEGVRCVTLKLFDTYGENDKRPKLINLLNKFADEGKELDMSLGEQKLDLVHIDMVTNTFIKAYELLKNNEEIRNEVYGVSSGKQVSLREIIKNFEKETGKKLKINWGARPYRKREVMEPIKSLKNLAEQSRAVNPSIFKSINKDKINFLIKEIPLNNLEVFI